MGRFAVLVVAVLVAWPILAGASAGLYDMVDDAAYKRAPAPQSAQRTPFPTPRPHVIVVRSSQGDMRTLHRGGWVRQERLSHGYTQIHMTGPNGHAYGISLSADGAPYSLSLTRAEPHVATGVRTNATDTILGERCTIWESAPRFEERVYGGPVLTCITADGIALWSGRRPPSTNEPRVDSIVVSVERRTPAWSEFSLPAETLDWAYWSSRVVLPPETARPAYEIRFGDRVVRVRGDARYEGRPNGFWLRSPGFQVHYSNQNGRSGISIDSGQRPPYPHPLSGGSEPMDRAPLRIGGESCEWRRVDLNVRWGVVGVCVTADGISFAHSTDYHDEARQDEMSVATSFQRGAPEAASMLPPENVFAPWVSALPTN